jgi:16S rRNA (cytosine967-C5)-methyltransferase
VSAAPGAALRALAARSLVAVLAEGRSLKAELAEVLPQIADPRDRALFEAICFAVLRHRRRYDHALSLWLARPLRDRDYIVHCLLLCGLAQLDELKLSAHAAVGATAEAARDVGRTPMVGLINALLRRATREPLPASTSLAVQTSHQDWLVDALARDWPDDVEAILRENNLPGPLWLRVNDKQVSRDAYLKLFLNAGGAAIAPEFPAQALRIDGHFPPETLPGWRAGSVLVQDGAAQLAVEALALQENEHVLDACAAPGGKCAQIAGIVGEHGFLLALDVDDRRLRKVRATLRRLHLETPNVELKAADAMRPSFWADGKTFDAILLDAPCSATGIIRRQPDVKWHRRAEDLPALVAQQAQMLDALWTVLKPGGRLLYATCSILKDENERQVAAFLQRTPDARTQALDARFGRVSGAGRQRLPGDDGMDGFFYALLTKQA